MIASLNVYEGETVNPVILVPLGSIVRSADTPDGYAVFTIQESDGKTRAQSKNIKLGSVYGNRIAVTQGLEQGERVVTIGAQVVRNGQEVSIIP